MPSCVLRKILYFADNSVFFEKLNEDSDGPVLPDLDLNDKILIDSGEIPAELTIKIIKGKCILDRGRLMATVEKIYFKKDDIWNRMEQIDLHVCELKRGKRIISFISSIGDGRLINDDVKGFCHAKFKANFVVSGIDVMGLTEGRLLQMGDAVIRVTEVGKECYADCPVIKKFNVLCSVNKQIFFGEILEAGIVREKDSIVLI